MFRTLLIAAFIAGGVSLADAALPAATRPAAMELPGLPHGPACGTGVRHVLMLAEAQMCPRPLATTIIAPPHHRLLHT